VILTNLVKEHAVELGIGGEEGEILVDFMART
jgi:hypothetical protein